MQAVMDMDHGQSSKMFLLVPMCQQGQGSERVRPAGAGEQQMRVERRNGGQGRPIELFHGLLSVR